jgi:small-conductance mechanosensitive channel
LTGTVSLQELLTAGALLAVGIIGAFVLRVIFTKLHIRAEDTKWGAVLVSFLRLVGPWWMAVGFAQGALFELSSNLQPRYYHDLGHVLLTVIVAVVTIAVAKVAGEAVHAAAVSHAGTSGSATIFVSITRVAVWTIGALILLDSLGVAVSPLLTALGVGGLAVALALQDTLSNLFAGIHILASRKVQPGDFIELDNGMQGYVVDTNWRNTILRQLPNNLLVVPNATVASSIVTNYHLPEHELSVTVPIYVSDECDLDEVERVTVEVGREVMCSVDGGVPEHEPTVRFTGIGNNSVNFNVGLRAAEVTKQALVTHEFIKSLHRRYRQDGIGFQSPNEITMYPALPKEHREREARDDVEVLASLDPDRD